MTCVARSQISPSAAELVTGTWNLNPVWNLYEPGLLVLVGTNPVLPIA